MEKIILGNWKMNKTIEDTENYLKEFEKLDVPENIKVGIAFPYIDISAAVKYSKNLLVGAQNVHYEESGAYTGEISASMLKSSKVDFAIVGHSERRKIFGETNKFINKKIKALLKYNIKVVLCIGEKESEKLAGKTKIVLAKQLEECLHGLYENELENIIIAYEPVWAIGTGKVANASTIKSTLSFIKQWIQKNFSSKAHEKVKFLYGGSVKPADAKKLIKIENVNGFLVGGASLKVEDFHKIITESK